METIFNKYELNKIYKNAGKYKDVYSNKTLLRTVIEMYYTIDRLIYISIYAFKLILYVDLCSLSLYNTTNCEV